MRHGFAVGGVLLLVALHNHNLGADEKAKARPLTVGYVYVGPSDDGGYSQASAQGAAALKQLKGIRCLEVDRVPETREAEQAMRRLIEQDHAAVVVATSFGYFDPHVLKLAREYPQVRFLHRSNLWQQGRHPDNISVYFGYIDEGQYVSGVVAGSMTRTNKLGFVAAKPVPQVLREINAFCLGARRVNPRAEVHVAFTGDWLDPAKEAEAATRFLNQKADVLACHVDSPKVVIETAEKRGAYSCGYHVSQARLAPKGYLTGAEWNWQKLHVDWVRQLQKGEKVPNVLGGGLKEGFIKMSPYGKAVTEKARKVADATQAALVDGSLIIFRGPLKDNTGKEVIPAGVRRLSNDPELEKMDYLVEGVVREAAGR